jgi:hypothetical protein
MPRGSRPGERRGGRQRATPNRRTVLTNRILAAAADNPVSSVNELVLVLAKDQGLPADIRMALARKASLFGSSRSMHSRSAAPNGRGKPPSKPGTKTGPASEANNKGSASKEDRATAAKPGVVTDMLFAMAQDTAASAADRRKAASQIAAFFLPKDAGGKKPRRGKFPPDEYGFVVDPKLAKELRDSKSELDCLQLKKTRTPHAFAQEARRLHARIEEIQRSLQCPCPETYGVEQIKGDIERLKIFADRRAQRELFSPEADLEEARRMARWDSFLKGPEVKARVRLKNLRDKKRVAQNGGPPITATQETMFRFLALLYPSPSRRSPSQEMIEAHPFSTDWPYPYIVGNPNYPEPESSTPSEAVDNEDEWMSTMDLARLQREQRQRQLELFRQSGRMKRVITS